MLSERIRPEVEAAPWVIDEIKRLEKELAAEKTRAIAAEKDAVINYLMRRNHELGELADMRIRDLREDMTGFTARNIKMKKAIEHTLRNGLAIGSAKQILEDSLK